MRTSFLLQCVGIWLRGIRLIGSHLLASEMYLYERIRYLGPINECFGRWNMWNISESRLSKICQNPVPDNILRRRATSGICWIQQTCCLHPPPLEVSCAKLRCEGYDERVRPKYDSYGGEQTGSLDLHARVGTTFSHHFEEKSYRQICRSAEWL